jgi:hypothetical protein
MSFLQESKENFFHCASAAVAALAAKRAAATAPLQLRRLNHTAGARLA